MWLSVIQSAKVTGDGHTKTRKAAAVGTHLCVKFRAVQIFKLFPGVCLQHALYEAIGAMEDADVKDRHLLHVVHVAQQQLDAFLEQRCPPAQCMTATRVSLLMTFQNVNAIACKIM